MITSGLRICNDIMTSCFMTLYSSVEGNDNTNDDVELSYETLKKILLEGLAAESGYSLVPATRQTENIISATVEGTNLPHAYIPSARTQRWAYRYK